MNWIEAMQERTDEFNREARYRMFLWEISTKLSQVEERMKEFKNAYQNTLQR